MVFIFQMERSPVITWLFHLRVATLLSLLFAINLTMINYAYNTTASKGPSVQLVFGFEYGILLTVVFNITVKYILHTIDLQSETPWDNKPVFLLYTELIIGMLKVIENANIFVDIFVCTHVCSYHHIFSSNQCFLPGFPLHCLCVRNDKVIYVTLICIASYVLYNARLQKSIS